MALQIIVDELLQGAYRAEGTAIIVDIFRNTSLITTLLGVGVEEIYPADGLNDATRLTMMLEKSAGKHVYLCGEQDGKTPSDFNNPNSPYNAYNDRDNLQGRTVVSTSSNGTRGILGAKRANEVLAASFLNYKAIAEYVQRTSTEKVTIVGLGNSGRPSVEDTSFSHFLKEIIEGEEPDIKKVRSTIYKGPTPKLMRKFFGPKVEKDIEFCLSTELEFNVVPKLYNRVILDALKEGK